MTKKIKRRSLFILIGVLIIISFGFYFILKTGSNEINVIDQINGYDYVLDSNDSKLTKKLFEELKEVLNSKEVDFSKYAENISKLFITDLYTMNTKINKYDVGGELYVHPKYVENYKLKVRDTLYKYLQESTFRDEALPEVSEITVISVESDKFKNDKKNYNSYIVELEWSYREDLGYDNKGKVTLIEDNNKLYVAEYQPEVSKWINY